jgi:hypothetical protein
MLFLRIHILHQPFFKIDIIVDHRLLRQEMLSLMDVQ